MILSIEPSANKLISNASGVWPELIFHMEVAKIGLFENNKHIAWVYSKTGHCSSQ